MALAMVFLTASLSLAFSTVDKSSSIRFVADGIRRLNMFSSLSMSDMASFGIADLLLTNILLAGFDKKNVHAF